MNRRYYNGVWIGRTTICCSAVALALSFAPPVDAQLPVRNPAADEAAANAPLALFPVIPLWSRPLEGVLTAPPGFGGTRGYFALDKERLIAYDLLNPGEVWSVEAQVLSRPAVGDGLVFVAVPDALMAFAADDGALAWRLPFAEALTAALVWDNGWLVAADETGAVAAFRAADGHLVWRREIGAQVTAPPALAADRVYLPTEDGRIVALRVDTGEPVWERRLGGPARTILALEERLFAGSDDNYLYSVKTADGVVDWRWRTGADVRGLPVADGTQIYFVSLDNVLRSLSRSTGNQRWKRAMPLRPASGPVQVSDTLLVSGLSPVLHGYKIADGAPAGEIRLQGELAGPPHPVPGTPAPTIAVVTRDIAKGAVLWAVARGVEPAMVPVAPLPNPVTISLPPSPPAPDSGLEETPEADLKEREVPQDPEAPEEPEEPEPTRDPS